MGAIVNGLALHGGIVKPYSATFLQFSDYMRGGIPLIFIVWATYTLFSYVYYGNGTLF